MKRSAAAVATAAVLMAGTATCFSGGISSARQISANQPYGNIPRLGGGTWTSTFDTEFTGTTLNSQWVAVNGWSVNNVTTSARNVSEGGGSLNLALPSSRSGATASTWLSRWGSGKDSYDLPVGGYVEASINFPGTTGGHAYNWPAFWTEGPNWPSNGEIDIAESLSRGLSTNYHSPSGSHDGPNPAGNWVNSYHVYGAYRAAKSISVYWDGNLVWTQKTDDRGGPQPLILNTGSGEGPAAYGDAATVRVQWVRAWK